MEYFEHGEKVIASVYRTKYDKANYITSDSDVELEWNDAIFMCIDKSNNEYPYLVCAKNGTGYQAVSEDEIIKIKENKK